MSIKENKKDFREALKEAHKNFPLIRSKYKIKRQNCTHDFSLCVFCDGGDWDIMRCVKCGAEVVRECCFDDEENKRDEQLFLAGGAGCKGVEEVTIDGDTFIHYYSESDFNYTIHKNERCKVITYEKILTIIGCVSSISEYFFTVRQDNGEEVNILYSDIYAIYGEREVGITQLS